MGENLRPLRGRVALREIVSLRTGLIWHPDHRPDTERTEDKSYGNLAQSSHRGRVLCFGPPALMYNRHEVPHGFAVGDEVVFVYGAGLVETGRRSTWTDDEPCLWVTQEEILAVVDA
jgi:co-chaperonin GroES (HSP10)